MSEVNKVNKVNRVDPVDKKERISNKKQQMPMSSGQQQNKKSKNQFKDTLAVENGKYKKKKDDVFEKKVTDVLNQKKQMEALGKISMLRNNLENVDTKKGIYQVNKKQKIAEYEKNSKIEER